MLKYLISNSNTLDFSIPAHQVAIYIFIIIMCLLFGKYRAGLIFSFIFTFYWVFILNHEKIKIFTGGENTFYMALYFICGFFVVALSLWAFITED